ncbi:MAG TPA: acetylglutamate kinase [Planctomycetota bacterium]
MIDILQAAPHVRMQRDAVIVIKVGGACLARPAAVRAFAKQAAVVQAFGALPVLVHGAGPQTGALQRTLGEEPRLVEGRRVTSPLGMRALQMAAAGELNPALCAALGAEGAPAVGVCGGAGGVLTARRRPPVPTSEGVIDFGEVGDLVAVDAAPLLALQSGGLIPVVCPPAGDGAGGFLNVNADLAAAAIAVALNASKLILLTAAPGVLRDPRDPHSLLSALSLAELDALEAEGALQDGMKVKAAAVRAALLGGVERVHIVSGTDPYALLRELYTNHGAGTLLTREPQCAPEEAEVA